MFRAGDRAIIHVECSLCCCFGCSDKNKIVVRSIFAISDVSVVTKIVGHCNIYPINSRYMKNINYKEFYVYGG